MSNKNQWAMKCLFFSRYFEIRTVWSVVANKLVFEIFICIVHSYKILIHSPIDSNYPFQYRSNLSLISLELYWPHTIKRIITISWIWYKTLSIIHFSFLVFVFFFFVFIVLTFMTIIARWWSINKRVPLLIPYRKL